jgi:excisionase family DNA binding protein
MQEQRRTLTPEEIAQTLRLHPEVIRRMMKRGEIPARKVGRLWRTDEAVFNAWLQQEGEQKMNEARIILDPNVAFGKPTIAGTRISVNQILEEIAAGQTIEDVMEQHDLTRKQVQAAFDYIAKLLAQVATNPAVDQAMA